jgi:hypothetical protein
VARLHTSTNFRALAASANATGAKGASGGVEAEAASTSMALFGASSVGGDTVSQSGSAEVASVGKRRSAGSAAVVATATQVAVSAVRRITGAMSAAASAAQLAAGATSQIVSGSIAFVTNTQNNNESARMTGMPAGFGVGEYTLEVRIWPDATIGFGSTSTQDSTNQRTLWSNNNATMYGNEAWWYDGNFLLDGHNNGQYHLGTLSIQFNNSGRAQVTIGDNAPELTSGGTRGNAGLHGLRSTTSLVDGNPHTITIVREFTGSTTAIYRLLVDGVEEDTETTSVRTNMRTWWDGWPGFPSQQAGWFWGAEKQAAIGVLAQYEDFKGLLGELRFWNVARSAAQIAAAWSTPIGASESGLVGLYRFGEASGNVCTDTKGSGGSITFVNGLGGQQVTRDASLWGAVQLANQSFTAGTPANVPLTAPAGHAAPFVSTGVALPSGVSISGSNLAWSGSGTPATTQGHIIRATALASAEADWLARSTAAGVVFTERFDSLMVGPGAGPGRYYNGDYGTRGFRDTTGPRVSGTGSLRLEHRSGENNANMTGSYTRFNADGGALLPNFAPGQVFYTQFRYRIDTNWFNNIPTWAGAGKKVILLHQDNISCGRIELTIQHFPSWYSTRIWRMYKDCGSEIDPNGSNLFTNTGNPNANGTPPILLQQRWDLDSGPSYTKVPGYEIQYGAGSAAGAFAPQANIWYTVDQRIQLPSAWGQSNARVEAWITEPGQTQRQKFISWIGAIYSNGEPQNFMNNFTLTTYMTGGANNAGTTGSCWYDEVIVSTQPIALPAALPVSG